MEENEIEIDLSDKYLPFMEVLDGQHPQVDTIIVTGGRDSGKSFGVSLIACEAASTYNHRILYTRYTLKSAEDSIIPDFTEKIDLLGYEDEFQVNKDRITSKSNDSKIVFKGIKTSSGIQTANLKSLKDFSMFIVEEAEEFPLYDEWDKIQLSIRATDVQSINVVILNPTSKKHWIYTEFFRRHGIEDGFNGVKGNILYIHTTYLDLGEKFIAPKNWRKYEAARIIHDEIEALSKDDRSQRTKDELRTWKYYKHVVLGGWKESEDGLVYPDWLEFDEFPEEYDLRIFGLDFGFNPDPLSFVECVIKGSDLYIKQHIYKTGLLNKHYVPMIKGVLSQYKDDHYIVADIAGSKDMAELAAEGIYTMPCDKTYGGSGMNKMRGIRKMQGKTLHIHKDSENVKDELMHYHYIEIVNSKGEVKTHVVDKDDHLMDAMLYACTRY